MRVNFYWVYYLTQDFAGLAVLLPLLPPENLEEMEEVQMSNYGFTISQRTAENLDAAMEQGNTILAFLKSEGYFEFKTGTKCKSTDFDKVYARWC